MYYSYPIKNASHGAVRLTILLTFCLAWARKAYTFHTVILPVFLIKTICKILLIGIYYIFFKFEKKSLSGFWVGRFKPILPRTRAHVPECTNSIKCIMHSTATVIRKTLWVICSICLRWKSGKLINKWKVFIFLYHMFNIEVLTHFCFAKFSLAPL